MFPRRIYKDWCLVVFKVTYPQEVSRITLLITYLSFNPQTNKKRDQLHPRPTTRLEQNLCKTATQK